MKLNWINQQNSNARSVALGTFDGVHLGHQKLLEKALMLKPKGGTSCVFTFDLPPEQFFQGQPRLVTPFEQKVRLLREFGIDEVAWLPFNQRVSSLEASEFVEQILVDGLRATQVICGFNYHFGQRRLGDVEFLREQGLRHGFDVTMVGPVHGHGSEVISSTVIRTLIGQGDMQKAAEYLGYYLSYLGKVVHGMGRGKELGFPTANLEFSSDLVLPGEGVYLTCCSLPNQGVVPAVTSIGKNPTFSGEVQTIETFILDFEADLYGEVVEIQFLERLRDIVRFDSVDELQRQIKEDVAIARDLFRGFRLQGSRIVLE